MRRSIKVGVALGLGVAGLAAWRCRQGSPKRPPVQRTLFLLTATVVAQWWNPITWFNDLAHLASNTVQDVENWVKNAINLAIGIYDAAIDLGMTAIEDAVGLVTNAVGILEHEATTLIEQAENVVEVLIPKALDSAISFATTVAGDVYTEAQGWVAGAVTLAQGLITDVENEAQMVFNDYIAPAVNWIEGAESWLANHLASWGASFLGTVDNLWNDAIGALTSIVDQISSTVFGEILTAVHGVEASWDWILWFGEHAIADFLDLPSEIESFGHASFAKSLLAGLHGQEGWVEQTLEDFLGS